jgi:hypothetical protein
MRRIILLRVWTEVLRLQSLYRRGGFELNKGECRFDIVSEFFLRRLIRYSQDAVAWLQHLGNNDASTAYDTSLFSVSGGEWKCGLTELNNPDGTGTSPDWGIACDTNVVLKILGNGWSICPFLTNSRRVLACKSLILNVFCG